MEAIMDSSADMQYDSSVGAIFIGSFLDLYLLGIVASQCYFYFRTFPSDRMIFKASVGFLMVVATLHSIFVSDLIFDWGVESYGLTDHLSYAPFTYAIDVPITGTSSFVCQTFFAHRVFLVSKNKIIPIIILILSTISLVFSWACMVKEYELKLYFASFPEFTYGVILWIASAVLADILITSTLCYYLRKERRSDYSSTNKIIDSIINLTVSTNATTTIVAIAVVICFAIAPDLWGSIVQFVLAKLYFNSYLSALNARALLAKQLGSASKPISGTHNLQSPRLATHSSTRIYTTSPAIDSDSNSTEMKPIRINITEIVEIDEMNESEKYWNSLSTRA